jgi:hypothetical protein
MPGSGRPFIKGQSGNPAGRPKKYVSDADVRRLCQREGQASIDALVRVRDDPKSPASAVIQAASTLLDRGYGKVTMPQVLSQPDTNVPTGVIEAPRPCRTAEEWQQSADAWVEYQRRLGKERLS